jgi:hypothetical protein
VVAVLRFPTLLLYRCLSHVLIHRYSVCLVAPAATVSRDKHIIILAFWLEEEKKMPGLFGVPEVPVLPPAAAEEEKGDARAPRAPAGGLAALLHHLLFRHNGYTEKPWRWSQT